MAQITAAQVKELRERTGAGMSDCKKALEATEGNLDAAAEKLRMDGAAKADKKAGRTAAEGVIGVARDDSAVAIVELNCETDFVAKGEVFRALAKLAAELALKSRPADLAALIELSSDGQTLEAKRRELVAKIGENLTIRRFEVVEKAGGPLVTYIHPGDKIAVVVAMGQGEADFGRDLAMHIAAMSPQHLDASAVPPEVLASERKIVEAQVAMDQEDDLAAGKPAKSPEIVAKMVEGKLRKFIAEITLHGQPFVKSPDGEIVEKLLKSKSASVVRFVRFAVGEGVVRQQTDFASEVQSLMA
jgi:elongation factor Ts